VVELLTTDLLSPNNVLEINGLINTNVGCNEFRPIGCSLHSCLFLGVPINWSLIDKVEDASDRSSSDKVMVQVCIHIVCEGDKLSQWSGHVLGNEFFNISIDSVCPIKLLIWQSREIRLFSAEPDGSMLHLDKVTNDVLDLLYVPFFLGATLKPDIVMTAVVISVLPRDSDHWRVPMSNW